MSASGPQVHGKRLLLTGASGFVGGLLRGRLEAAGYRVFGLSSRTAEGQDLALDICDAEAVAARVRQVQPERVVHLAALTHVPTSFTQPLLTWQTNLMGTLNLLQALRQEVPEAFLLLVSSSEVYGEAFQAGIPLTEDCPGRPITPYGASKLAAELACQQYFRQGMPGLIVRPFNHIGALQSPDFVTASFARQIARIEMGHQAPVIQVGNLDAYRDFLDVRDVCDAYLALLDLAGQSVEPRVLNVASGQPRQIRQVLTELLHLSAVSIQVEPDPTRLRPSDIPFAVGDATRLQTLTGWRPRIDFTATLTELLDYWRGQEAASP